jgi:hypothetical protein
MKEITKNVVFEIHNEIERIGGIRFLEWKKSRFYSILAKSSISKIGNTKEQIDDFIKSTAMTTPFRIMIPYEVGSSRLYSFRQQIEIAGHEFQHVLDFKREGKFRANRRYITDKYYRALIEAKGYSVSDEINYMLGMQLGPLKISKIYRLERQHRNVFLKIRENTRKNISNGQSYESSRFIYDILK